MYGFTLIDISLDGIRAERKKGDGWATRQQGKIRGGVISARDGRNISAKGMRIISARRCWSGENNVCEGARRISARGGGG